LIQISNTLKNTRKYIKKMLAQASDFTRAILCLYLRKQEALPAQAFYRRILGIIS